MYAFTFTRPTTVRQAANILAKDEDAKLLAGQVTGHAEQDEDARPGDPGDPAVTGIAQRI